uniref:Uncharacterized protein n=1 Tax=Timema cristinae TaxID=61476 RepID=A0A7R9GVS3_TIMCR|nr:unnamed protein product [Timema cristinae]
MRQLTQLFVLIVVVLAEGSTHPVCSLLTCQCSDHLTQLTCRGAGFESVPAGLPNTLVKLQVISVSFVLPSWRDCRATNLYAIRVRTSIYLSYSISLVLWGSPQRQAREHSARTSPDGSVA